jgi:hypothetical protein
MKKSVEPTLSSASSAEKSKREAKAKKQRFFEFEKRKGGRERE